MRDNDKIKLFDLECLGSNIYVLHKNHEKYLNKKLMQYDLNLIQALCILKINSEEGLSQKDLSDDFYITKGAITKAISKLESKGIVVREKSFSDKRRNVLKLSEEGEVLVPALKDIGFTWVSEMGLLDLDPEFLSTFKKLVAKSIEINKQL